MRAALWRYTPLLIVALIWEVSTQLDLISEYVLPKLSSVCVTLFKMFFGDLWVHMLYSLKRVALGLGAAIIFGTLTGILMAWYRTVRLLLNPIVKFLYSIPKSALIPIMIMWMGLGDASTVTLIFIGCMMPVVISSYNAARGVNQVLLWSARGMGSTEGNILWSVVIPASLPDILNGIRTALALAFILMISSEMIIGQNGLGYVIGLLGETGDYEGMFAGVLLVSALGLIADRSYMVFTRRLLIWREH